MLTLLRKHLRWLVCAALVLPPLALFALAIGSWSRPDLGLDAGTLKPLQDRPNGVSSLANGDRRVEPLTFTIPAAAAADKLKSIVTARPRTVLVAESPGYLRFECTSLLFRFCDDLEFHIRADAGRIDVRAASRVGYSDMGANEARVEEIRAAWKRAKC